MKSIKCFVIVACLGLPTITYSQEINGFIGAFIDNCGTRAGDISRLSTMIEIDRRFEPLSQDLLEMISPKKSDGFSDGWIVKEGFGAPYILSVNTIPSGQLGVNEQIICSMIGDHISGTHLAEKLDEISLLEGLIDTNIQRGQQIRIWKAESLAQGAHIMLNDSSPLGLQGVTLSSIAPFR